MTQTLWVLTYTIQVVITNTQLLYRLLGVRSSQLCLLQCSMNLSICRFTAKRVIAGCITEKVLGNAVPVLGKLLA